MWRGDGLSKSQPCSATSSGITGHTCGKNNVVTVVNLVWMAFRFRNVCANWLTNQAYDPETLTAEYKACAVRVEKI
jgi:hypothetical protein